MTKQEIRKKFKEMNVVFVSNTNCMMPSLLSYSLRTYIDLADGNFVLYPANMGNGRLYGFSMFYNMIYGLVQHYDYAIYFDDDAFLVPGAEEAFFHMFEKFVESGSLIAGTPDGGVVCHRNHNPFMVNTFVSFWNFKEMRVHAITPELLTAKDSWSSINSMTFHEYDGHASYKSMLAMKDMHEAAIADSAKKREGIEVPYAAIVRNDPSNLVDPHQEPWSTKLDDFEPYYKLIEWLLLKCDGTIWYFNARDKVSGLESSGLSSEIYVNDNDGNAAPVIWHSWFSRQWMNPSSPHHERIAKLLQDLGLS